MTHHVKRIFFDLDGTLRHSRPTFNQKFFEVALRLGWQGSPEDHRNSMRWQHYYWAQSPEMLADRDLFGEQHDLFWANHARLSLVAAGLSEEEARGLAPDVYRIMHVEFTPGDWIPEDVPTTLQALIDQGFDLGLITNRTSPCDDELARLGLDQFFDPVLVAGVVDIWKPDPRIFIKALQYSGTQARETIYVGDNYYADVLGSQQAGMHPVLLDIEGIFPDAECQVIRSIGEMCSLLEKQAYNGN